MMLFPRVEVGPQPQVSSWTRVKGGDQHNSQLNHPRPAVHRPLSGKETYAGDIVSLSFAPTICRQILRGSFVILRNP